MGLRARYKEGHNSMPIKVAVLKEVRPEERRVAIVHAVVNRLLKRGTEL